MFLARILLVLFGIFSIVLGNTTRTFPDDFKFAAATAAYQVEGAWNVNGKTPSIWDKASHEVPSRIAGNATGDIANDSFNLYKRDVEMCRELNLDYYRFSISWPRILNSSFPEYINQDGVDYYNNLINELLKYNIEPMVTIYHWDLPQKLQDMGGWTNPEIITWFTDYARVLFELFGDRVKYWITMNEPREICLQAYSKQVFAPFYNITGYAEYLCGRNLLLAHSKCYHMYNDEFRATQKGNISIVLSCEWYEPNSDSEDDIAAANDMMMFDWDQFAHPIFSESGDYPAGFIERIANKSEEQGFPRSRLQNFTSEQIEYIRGTSDFYCLNHYSTYLAYRNDSLIGYYPKPSYYDDASAIFYQNPDWAINAVKIIKTTPWGFYKLLMRISSKYSNVTIHVTENGITGSTGVNDTDRVTHMRLYLNAICDAIEAGCDVKMYTVWSLMDNFSWAYGYNRKFGLYEVDYDDANRTRTPRKSAFIYKEIARTKTLDFDYEPENDTMTIDDGH